MSEEEKLKPLPMPKKISRRISFDKPTLSLIQVEQLIELSMEQDVLNNEVLRRSLSELKKLKLLCTKTWQAWDDGDEEEVARLIEIMGAVATT